MCDQLPESAICRSESGLVRLGSALAGAFGGGKPVFSLHHRLVAMGRDGAIRASVAEF